MSWRDTLSDKIIYDGRVDSAFLLYSVLRLCRGDVSDFVLPRLAQHSKEAWETWL
ncbi:MAG: hypothetical protein LBE70_03085 [Nitrososphaerota archaeon]|nr:hypothetical protein [Nitrososphaerota archaeon]